MRLRPQAPDARARSAVRDLLVAPTFELIPLAGIMLQAGFLPPGSRVSVTVSPTKGIGATIEAGGRLAAAGFDVAVHLSARQVSDRSHLVELMRRMLDLNVSRAFIVGGDATEHGEFKDGLALLRAIKDLGLPMRELGCPGYPEGHPVISDDVLTSALLEKQAYVQYVTTQLCFDPAAIVRWVRDMRALGLTRPVVVGLPGVTELHKLLTISAKIGVADSRRFLRKNARLVGRLVRPGGYDPETLLGGLGSHLLDPTLHVSGVHLYTFNQAEVTEAWRRRYLGAVESAPAVR